MDTKWIDYVKEIQAIAQAGLTFTKNEYELERYARLRTLSVEMMSHYSHTSPEIVNSLFANERGYQTPKIDIRSVVFSADKILMVQETIDHRWSLPGGYADIGISPKEVAVKETLEEAGYHVVPVKLLAVLDKRFHQHPVSPFHLYKIFFLCEIIDHEALPKNVETCDVGFFSLENLPPLSTGRVTTEQLDLMFQFHNDPLKEPVFD